MNNINFFYFFINFNLNIHYSKFDEVELEPDDVVLRGNDIFDDRYFKAKHSGYDARLGEFPFMVAVFNARNKSKDICGGLIVTENVILTAGYCVLECKYDPASISVLGGVVDMRDHDNDQWRWGKEIYFYDKEFAGYPYLALVQLDSPFYLQYLIQKRPLPTEPLIRQTNCYISGWALEDIIESAIVELYNSEIDLKSLILKYSEADPMEKILCDQFYKNYSLESVNEIICLTDVIRSHEYADCAGNDSTVLSCYDNSLDILIPVGIATQVRGGTKCKFSDIPSTFYDIGHFTNWINKILKET